MSDVNSGTGGEWMGQRAHGVFARGVVEQAAIALIRGDEKQRLDAARALVDEMPGYWQGDLPDEVRAARRLSAGDDEEKR